MCGWSGGSASALRCRQAAMSLAMMFAMTCVTAPGTKVSVLWRNHPAANCAGMGGHNRTSSSSRGTCSTSEVVAWRRLPHLKPSRLMSAPPSSPRKKTSSPRVRRAIPMAVPTEVSRARGIPDVPCGVAGVRVRRSHTVGVSGSSTSGAQPVARKRAPGNFRASHCGPEARFAILSV